MTRASPEADTILAAIRAAGFEPLGWLQAELGADLPPAPGGHRAATALLVGNAGPAMFGRFAAERDPDRDLLDDWTRDVIDPLAARVGASAVYPFDRPYLPFLRWAQMAGCGHVSPLGLNIHPVFGLWHAFRAALLFAHGMDFGALAPAGPHPCERCVERPCLSACPVSAFSGTSYDVAACAGHLSGGGAPHCMDLGCQARLACPVGKEFHYAREQRAFHMTAFAMRHCNPPSHPAPCVKDA